MSIERMHAYVLQETGVEGLGSRSFKVHGVYLDLFMAMMELRKLVQGQEEFCPHYFSRGFDVVEVKFAEGRRTGDSYIIERIPITASPGRFLAEVGKTPTYGNMSPKAMEAWDRAVSKEEPV